MKVTRDVMYDLLPAYCAGDASADTRALIDEYSASDPEFARMAERFRKMAGDRPVGNASEPDRDRAAFDRARARMQLRMAAGIWALGALLPFAMVAAAWLQGELTAGHPGLVIGAVFAGASLATWVTSHSRRPEDWRAMLSGE